MPLYRAYQIVNGAVNITAAIITCDTDAEAIKQAKKLVDGSDVELWEGARFVIGLTKNEDTK